MTQCKTCNQTLPTYEIWCGEDHETLFTGSWNSACNYAEEWADELYANDPADPGDYPVQVYMRTEGSKVCGALVHAVKLKKTP